MAEFKVRTKVSRYRSIEVIYGHSLYLVLDDRWTSGLSVGQ
jgi:hypothetical protein